MSRRLTFCFCILDAVLRAVTAVFGLHISHQGCFYHLTQASWRKIQQLSLVPLYKNDDDFRVFCGMMVRPDGQLDFVLYSAV
jgi:hypothetical protein